MSGVLALGLGLIGAGYLIIHFVVLVLEDADNDHEAAQGPAYDAQTVAWLKSLREPVAPVEVTPTGDGGMDDLLLEVLMPTRRTDGAS